MARIGKIVTFESNREYISDLLILGMQKLAIISVNWNFVNDNTMNIYGEQADLTTLKNHANSKGIGFDIIGDAPAEPVVVPDPAPTQEELDSIAFMKTALQNMKQSEKDRLLTILQTEYDAINTTSITFANAIKPDFAKWLR